MGHRRALVLLSGGLDSAVALAWALHEGHEVVALSYRYKGRPAREARAARALAEHAGVALLEADLPFLAEPADAPDLHADSRVAIGAPRGYIPARNAIFYACAAYHAEIHACELVVGGHNADDAGRFPDATHRFFARLESLLADGLWSPQAPEPRASHPPPRFVMPLQGLTKRGVVALGRELGVPLTIAWSCYEDVESPCGACPSCVERESVALAFG